jgi:signal transduction histidine kinase
MRNVVNLIQIPGSSEGELRWGRDILDRQVNYLTRLTDDLFDVSRITRQKLDLQKERVDLREIVNAAVESSHPFIDEREHELAVTLHKQAIYIEADRVRIAQVLMNLLTNAAKYTPKPGEISLERRAGGRSGLVRVKGHRSRPFRGKFSPCSIRFTKWTAHTGLKGLGLGLLVRQLVEMHGGTIEARSAASIRQ